MTRLAKEEERIYIKREPRLLRLTETGAGTARFAPPCTATVTGQLFYDPDPPRMGRGQLLSSGGRQQQDKGHCDE